MKVRSTLRKVIMGDGHGEFDIVIEPNKTTVDYFRELIKFRELFFFLAWRDIIVRYKQTVVGVAWSLIRPFLSMIVFTVVFGKIAKLPSEGVPYPILVFSALIPWQYFANALQRTAGSVLGGGGMINKIYFPRLVLPISAVIVNAVDTLISFALLCLLMLIYGFMPSPLIILLPFFVMVATLAAMGVGFWFAAIGVRYRDFNHIVPFIVQFGLYASPVGFSSSIIPERWRLIYSLNPMVGVIDGFRWCIQGTSVSLYIPGFIISLIASSVIFYYGQKFFRKMERSFADYI
ncbi:MAG: ABC transporter permease [Synergistaceae bacterium]|nr:ABC transporter permease [Synergistaceae bacterium]